MIDQLASLLIAALVTGSIYALVALGFSVLYKSTGAINFAQGEWVMAGGMVAAWFVQAFHPPLALAVVLAVAVVIGLGIVSELLAIEPLRGATPLGATMVTIGVAISTKALVTLVIGKQPMGLPSFIPGPALHAGPFALERQALAVIVVTAFTLWGMQQFFVRSLLGRAMRAAAADPTAAAIVGIDPSRTTRAAFAIAAGLGAIAGVIMTPITLTSFNAGALLGFKGFSAAMLGGLGSLPGAVIGGLLLAALESFAKGYISSNYADAVAFIVLLAVLFTRPAGILGRNE
jgi:branched-chain amino acid transport system permease protein